MASFQTASALMPGGARQANKGSADANSEDGEGFDGIDDDGRYDRVVPVERANTHAIPTVTIADRLTNINKFAAQWVELRPSAPDKFNRDRIDIPAQLERKAYTCAASKADYTQKVKNVVVHMVKAKRRRAPYDPTGDMMTDVLSQ